jgi:hypothetical protein
MGRAGVEMIQTRSTCHGFHCDPSLTQPLPIQKFSSSLSLFRKIRTGLSRHQSLLADSEIKSLVGIHSPLFISRQRVKSEFRRLFCRRVKFHRVITAVVQQFDASQRRA